MTIQEVINRLEEYKLCKGGDSLVSLKIATSNTEYGYTLLLDEIEDYDQYEVCICGRTPYD